MGRETHSNDLVDPLVSRLTALTALTNEHPCPRLASSDRAEVVSRSEDTEATVVCGLSQPTEHILDLGAFPQPQRERKVWRESGFGNVGGEGDQVPVALESGEGGVALRSGFGGIREGGGGVADAVGENRLAKVDDGVVALADDVDSLLRGGPVVEARQEGEDDVEVSEKGGSEGTNGK